MTYQAQELDSAVPGICAGECSDDEEMIPKLEECAEVEKSDAVNTSSDQCGSSEKIPAMSVASVAGPASPFSVLHGMVKKVPPPFSTDF